MLTTIPVFAATEIRVNSGGGQYTDGSANIWSADFGFNTGYVGLPFKPITGTTDQALLNDNRYDLDAASELLYSLPVTPELIYSFAVPNADYTVRLHFAETFDAPYAVGARVFDIDMEGGRIWSNLDIYNEAGAETMLVKENVVTVSDGQLDIEFLHGLAGHPMVSALEIIELSPGPVDPLPPTVPSGVTASAISDTQIDLSWAASTDAGGGIVAGYNIFRDGAATAIATVTGTSYSDTGLTADTSYNYTVSAFDNATPANESAESSVANATTLPADILAPTVPTGLTATAISASQIDLSWAASTDLGGGTVAGYKIFRDGGATEIATVVGTSYSDTDLTENTAYGYTVSAFDDTSPANESAKTSVVNRTTLVDSQAPSIPIGLNAAATSDTQIDLSWIASTDNGGGLIAGYNIYRDGSGTPIATVTTTGYSDTGLTAETLYSYTVSAFDDAAISNESAESSAATATTLAARDIQPPTVPTTLSATATSDTQIDLSWSASTDVGGGNVAGYNIYRDSVLVTSVAGTSYSDTALAANTNYSYTVSAFDDATPANESAQSAAANATTFVAPTAIRVNSGGGQYTDGFGNVWSADYGFNIGGAGGPYKTIAGTSDQPLFDNNRFDLLPDPELMYSFAIPNGQYTVRLYFAETYTPLYGAGLRVFDVAMEGHLVWKDLDVFAAVGSETMLVKENAVTVSDGQINIEFLHGLADHPMVSAIEIVATSVAEAAPTIDPLGGTYFGPVDVTLNTAMPSGQIYYTLDGSVPTQASTPYTVPFAISSNAQLKTRAFNGVNSSSTSVAHFTVFAGPLSYDFASADVSDWVTVNDSTGVSNWSVIGGEFVQSYERGIVFPIAEPRETWTDAPSSFAGTYHLGTYAYLSTGMGLTNYRVSLDMTPIPDSSWYVVENGHDIGVMFRYVDIDNYYRLSLNSAYGFARLEKKVGGVFTTLAVDGRGYQSENQVINISIEVMNDLIHVYVNGEARFAFQDTDLSSGSIALYTQDGAKFDNIIVNNNNTAPAIIIDDPLAYTVGLVNQFTVSAVVMNMPAGGSVEFDIDGSLCTPVTEDSPGYFSATCPVVSAGEHTVTAILKDSGSVQVASDINAFVGSSGDNYVTIGDSISNGIGDKYQSDNGSIDGKIISSQAYASVLHDLLNTSKSTPQFVFNEGISGETTNGTLNNRINSILERQYNANKALIMLGTNDSSGLTPIDSGFDCTGAGCDGTYRGNMQAIIDLLLSNGITPIIAYPPPAFGDKAGRNKTILRNVELGLEGYIPVIQTKLSGHQIGPDFYSYFLDAGQDRISLFIDDLHPNALGHLLMAHLWDHYLNGNTSLPTRSQLPLVLEDICIRLTSASCETPLAYKQNLLEADGDPYYVDETFSLTSIPAILQDGLWLRPSNADQANTRNDYLTFTVDRNVDVYVAYDPGATTLPDWMAGFTDTTQDLGVTDAGSSTLKLYHKTYVIGVDTPADGTIQLGGNLATGAVGAGRNYVVIVKEQ